ncbi:MAG TPA: SMI1/KNR4 family protein [Tepidisphaeraceae bacterium]|jgi:hypothetical protein
MGPFVADFARTLRMPDGSVPVPWCPRFPFAQEEHICFARSGGQGYTADGLFHFFGESPLSGHDFESWNDVGVWRQAMFSDLQWFSIAEDAFGYQFCMRPDGRRPVVKALSLWDGSFTLIANTFTDFIVRIVLDETSWCSMRNRYSVFIKQNGMAFRPLAHLSFKVPPLLSRGDIDHDVFEWTESMANASVLSQVLAGRKSAS